MSTSNNPADGFLKTIRNGTKIYIGDRRTEPFTEAELKSQFTLHRGEVYAKGVPYEVWSAEWDSWMERRDRDVIEEYVQRMEANGAHRANELREMPQMILPNGKPVSRLELERLIKQSYYDARNSIAFSADGAADAASQIAASLESIGIFVGD